MDSNQLVDQANRIIGNCRIERRVFGALAEAREFLRTYAGEKSAFYRALSELQQSANPGYNATFIVSALEGFIQYVENGLLGGTSIERQARVDVVSDFLEQAQTLLESQDVHPAAPTVLVGAALEEFLRTWVEDAGLNIGQGKPGIDTYSSTLRGEDLITKQDAKDIVSWAGSRNHAAHGEWAEVEDRARVSLMLEGVNLFMRKYTP